MSDNPEAAHERAAIQHMMRRLDGFARGLGLDEAATRQIFESAAANVPMGEDDEQMVEARTNDAATARACLRDRARRELNP